MKLNTNNDISNRFLNFGILNTIRWKHSNLWWTKYQIVSQNSKHFLNLNHLQNQYNLSLIISFSDVNLWFKHWVTWIEFESNRHSHFFQNTLLMWIMKWKLTWLFKSSLQLWNFHECYWRWREKVYVLHFPGFLNIKNQIQSDNLMIHFR